MSKERDISFPPGEIGKLHTEHGRTWRYVEPGMWKSVNTSGGGGGGSWDDIEDKPTEFPPESHTHDQYALQADLTAESTARGAADDALGLRIDAVEGSIGDGGGFIDAPNDGKLYGRQSEAWAEVVIPDGGASTWDEIADKPTEFPPAAHNQGWDTITDKPDDFPPSAHGHAWDEITGKPTEFPPESHNHVVADITDFDPADYQPKGDYQPAGDYIGEAPNDGKQYVRESEAWAEVSIPEPDTSNNLEGEWAYNSADPGVGEWTSRNADWLMPTTITLHKTDAAGYEHSFALMTVGDVIYVQGPAGGAEYEITATSVVADSATFDVQCLSRFGDFPSQGASTHVTFIPQVKGGAVQIGETFEGTPSEGDQWLETPAGEEAVMWIYDGEKWLQMPGGGGAGDITTATLPLANPTREATGLSTQLDANVYFADSLAKLVNDDGDVIGPDLSEYYTSTEVDNAFQPKGDYIADAPSDGNLYIRKDGGWEVYVPSSGGGGSVGMEAIQQPQEWGDFKCQHGGEYYAKDLGDTKDVTLTVPDGMMFVLSNFSVELSAVMKESEIYIDGIQMFPGASGVTQAGDDNEGYCLRYDGQFIVNDTLKWTATKNGPNNNAVRVYGYFVPDAATMRARNLEAMSAEETSDE